MRNILKTLFTQKYQITGELEIFFNSTKLLIYIQIHLSYLYASKWLTVKRFHTEFIEVELGIGIGMGSA